MALNKKLRFNPLQLGFVEIQRGYKNVIYKLYDKKNQLIGWIVYYDFSQPSYWLAYKEIHHDNSDSTSSLVFQGNIPNNAFAKQLFKNIL